MKIQSLAVLGIVLLGLIGCSAAPPEPTPEQKKAFSGGPPPADFMEKNVKSHMQAPPTNGGQPPAPPVAGG